HPKPSVLFVCIHNSARSQMAEAFLKKFGKDRFDVESAGIEPGTLNALVVKAMREVGIDIAGNATKSVDRFLNQGRTFDYVITVCDETNAERCPTFPGKSTRLHWGFPDPSLLTGTDDEKYTKIQSLRFVIESRVRSFVLRMNHVIAPGKDSLW